MSFHIPETQSQVLAGRVGLVTGIANDQSIAFGCARALGDGGASLAITYLDDKAKCAKRGEPETYDLAGKRPRRSPAIGLK